MLAEEVASPDSPIRAIRLIRGFCRYKLCALQRSNPSTNQRGISQNGTSLTQSYEA